MTDKIDISAVANPTDEPFTLGGISVIDGGGPEYTVIASLIGRGRPLILQGAVSPPDPTFSVTLVGVPDQLEVNNSVRISAEIRDQFGQLVDEEYTRTHWSFQASAGASFGVGADSDLLTAGGSPASVVITATYDNQDTPESPANGEFNTAIVAIVNTVTIDLQITAPSATVIEGQSYDLRAREVDGVTGAPVPGQDPATGVTWTRISGAGVVNGSVLTVNPTSAGQTVTVRVTKPGRTQDEQIFTIAAQPVPGDFFDNEPPGFTPIININGSTVVFPGFTNPDSWANVPNRISVVADAASKHGTAVEKKFFIGDESGWHGVTIQPTSAVFTEVYSRLIFRLSPNWQFHKAGEKLLVNRRDLGGQRAIGPDFHMQASKFQIIAGVKKPGIPPSNPATPFFPIIPGSPPYTGGQPGSGPFPSATRNVYHTLEQVRRINSAFGVADGYMRQWINGVEYTRFHGFGASGYLDVTLDAIEWISPLGGGHTSRPPGISPSVQVILFWCGQNDTKSVDDAIYLSELYVSGRN